MRLEALTQPTTKRPLGGMLGALAVLVADVSRIDQGSTAVTDLYLSIASLYSALAGITDNPQVTEAIQLSAELVRARIDYSVVLREKDQLEIFGSGEDTNVIEGRVVILSELIDDLYGLPGPK